MDNDLQFKYKYLKYKFKYVQLKKQQGGDFFTIKVINNDTDETREIELDENQLEWKEISRELKIPENVEVYYLNSNGKKNIIKNDKTYEKAYNAYFGDYTLYYETPEDVKAQAVADARKKKEAEKLASAQASAAHKEKAVSERKKLIDSIQNSLNDFQIYNTQLKTTNPPDKRGRIKNIFPNEFVDITDVKIEFNSTEHSAYHNVRKGERGQYLLSEGDIKWITINLHLNNKNNRWEYQVSIFKYENNQGNMYNFSRYVFSVNKDLGGPIVYDVNPDEQLSRVQRSTFDKEQIQSLLVDTIFTAITAPMPYSIRIAK